MHAHLEPGLKWNDLAPGDRLDGFEIVTTLGLADGVVYKALREEACFALKVRDAHKPLSAEREARLQRELDVMARLPPGLGVVGARHRGQGEGFAYVAVDFVEGQELEARIRVERVRVRDRVELFMQLLEVVGRVHAAGVIHRTLSTANVLVGRGEQPFVLGFGDAKLVGEANVPGEESGTRSYRAPEQVLGAPDAGPAVDQHALGVILYELLTEERPYRGQTVEQVNRELLIEPPEPPRSLNRELSRDLDDLVLRALAKDPEDRFASVDAFREALSWVK